MTKEVNTKTLIHVFILRTKRALKMSLKALYIILKGFQLLEIWLRPRNLESAPLMHLKTFLRLKVPQKIDIYI